MKALLTLCLALCGVLGAVDARAHTCSVQATALAFGGYASPNGPRVDSTATVQVNCTPTYLLLACSVSYTLSLSHGTVGTPGARRMAAGTGQLHYDLYRDASRTVPWGDGGGGAGVRPRHPAPHGVRPHSGGPERAGGCVPGPGGPDHHLLSAHCQRTLALGRRWRCSHQVTARDSSDQCQLLCACAARSSKLNTSMRAWL
jgi:hypothetical protein